LYNAAIIHPGGKNDPVTKQLKTKGLGAILLSQGKLIPEDLQRFSEEAALSGQTLAAFLLQSAL